MAHVKTADTLYRRAIEAAIVELFGPPSTPERREIDAGIKAALDEARDAMLSQSTMVTWWSSP